MPEIIKAKSRKLCLYISNCDDFYNKNPILPRFFKKNRSK